MGKNNKKKSKLVEIKKDGKYLIKNRKEIIRKKVVKRRIRRCIMSIILLISILVTLALKLELFDIKQVEVEGNRKITKTSIVTSAQVEFGENIFYFNSNKAKKNILENPYILEAKVKRVIPDKIHITVEERIAEFYLMNKNLYYIINDEGVLLETRNDIEGMKLVELKGMDLTGIQLGGKVNCDDDRKYKIIKELSQLINNNTSDLRIKEYNFQDITDMYLYINDMKVIIGPFENIEDKINKAINIIINRKLEEMTGYIDVSFEGNPILHLDIKEEW